MSVYQKICNYQKYLRDNPDKLWFARKSYGWGWEPARWQGWVSLGIFVVLFTALMLWFATHVSGQDEHDIRVVIFFLVTVIILAALLIGVSYATGESPRWQWGKRSKKPSDDSK